MNRPLSFGMTALEYSPHTFNTRCPLMFDISTEESKTAQEVMIDELKQRYLDGEISISELERRSEKVYAGESDAHEYDGKCLVCGHDIGMYGLGGPGNRVSCPGCGKSCRPRRLKTTNG